MQLHCAATMDRTSATTHLVPKDQQSAYALRALGLEDGSQDNVLVDPPPEGWHPETHNRDADSSMRGHIPPDGVLDHCLFTPAGSWVLYAPPPPPATVFCPVPVVSTAVTWR